MYYLEVAGDGDLVIHRGDKSGPVMATCDPCAHRTETMTDIRFFDGTGDIHLHHMPHKMLHKHGETRFTYGTKKYRWIGHMDSWMTQQMPLLLCSILRGLTTVGTKLGDWKLCLRGENC